jgi:hypothetical protein
VGWRVNPYNGIIASKSDITTSKFLNINNNQIYTKSDYISNGAFYYCVNEDININERNNFKAITDDQEVVVSYSPSNSLRTVYRIDPFDTFNDNEKTKMEQLNTGESYSNGQTYVA